MPVLLDPLSLQVLARRHAYSGTGWGLCPALATRDLLQHPPQLLQAWLARMLCWYQTSGTVCQAPSLIAPSPSLPTPCRCHPEQAAAKQGSGNGHHPLVTPWLLLQRPFWIAAAAAVAAACPPAAAAPSRLLGPQASAVQSAVLR
jgi:hypothetical protein